MTLKMSSKEARCFRMLLWYFVAFWQHGQKGDRVTRCEMSDSVCVKGHVWMPSPHICDTCRRPGGGHSCLCSGPEAQRGSLSQRDLLEEQLGGTETGWEQKALLL